MTGCSISSPTQIEISFDDDPFREFLIVRDFNTVGNGCRIGMALTCDVRSKPPRIAIDRLPPRTARARVSAFQKRAAHLRS